MARTRNPNAPLKKKFVSIARALVARHGPDQLTIRGVATKADVSSNAPLHHYPEGVPELLADVATLGFKDLIDQMMLEPVVPDPLARVDELMLRYVGFGVRNANLYRAMFSSKLAEPLARLTGDGPPQPGHRTFAALDAIKDEAYQCLIEPLVALDMKQLLRGEASASPGLALAALAHGLVGEFIDEGLMLERGAKDQWTAARIEMTSEITTMLLSGIVLPKGRKAKPSRATRAAKA